MKKVIQGDLEVSGRIKDTPKVWTVDDADIQNLESFLNEHSSEIKVGDVIHSNDDGLTATVYVINGGECKMYCATQTTFPISYILYYYDDGEWVFDEMTTHRFGVRLYRHRITFSSNDELRLVSTKGPKKYSTISELETDYTNNRIISGYVYGNKFEDNEGAILCIKGSLVSFFEENTSSIQILDIHNLTIVGDTTTEL